jgi:hypothetical protein
MKKYENLIFGIIGHFPLSIESTAISCESFQAEPSALSPPINRIFWWTALRSVLLTHLIRNLDLDGMGASGSIG